MQHKVFIALFVPFSLTLCGCPWCALSSFNLLLSACVDACTHKHPSPHNHAQRGVPGVGHNYCVYCCLLIMSDRPHHFCSPAVSCALPPEPPPQPPPNPPTHTQCLGGTVSSHAGLQKTFTGCQFAFYVS